MRRAGLGMSTVRYRTLRRAGKRAWLMLFGARCEGEHTCPGYGPDAFAPIERAALPELRGADGWDFEGLADRGKLVAKGASGPPHPPTLLRAHNRGELTRCAPRG